MSEYQMQRLEMYLATIILLLREIKDAVTPANERPLPTAPAQFESTCNRCGLFLSNCRGHIT